jgi:hypothetical protein
MSGVAQIELLPAQAVAQQAPVEQAQNGICYASFGQIHLPHSELERLVQVVPQAIAHALKRSAFYFVPLTLQEAEQTMVAVDYSSSLADRAICHRNVHFGESECVFISARLMQDRFGLSFEFFINAAHHFIEAIGVSQSFADLVWAQAEADVRGETSQDAWENRRRSFAGKHSESGVIDERAKTAYLEAAFADALAIYMLSIAIDFDYLDLREREYPLLAAPAMAERLRHVAALFPANPGYDFEIRYRRRS